MKKCQTCTNKIKGDKDVLPSLCQACLETLVRQLESRVINLENEREKHESAQQARS